MKAHLEIEKNLESQIPAGKPSGGWKYRAGATQQLRSYRQQFPFFRYCSTMSLEEEQYWRATRFAFTFGCSGGDEYITAEEACMATVQSIACRAILAGKLASASPHFWGSHFVKIRRSHGIDKNLIRGVIRGHATKLEKSGFDPANMILVRGPYQKIPGDDVIWNENFGSLDVLVTSIVENSTYRVLGDGKNSDAAWPDDVMVLAYKPGPMEDREHGTFLLKYVEGSDMVVETVEDENGRRGRVVDEFSLSINPEFGMLISIED